MSCTGVVILDIDTYKPVHISSIKTRSNKTHGKRLHSIREYMKNLKDEYPPEIICIERGFTRFNKATQAIYKCHGVINEMFKDYEQIYYPPMTVKASILSGNSSKAAIKNSILTRYPEVEFKNNDESDAFAVALTYLINNKGLKWK